MAELNPQPLPPGTKISVRVAHDVTVDQLKQLITVIGGRTGCRTCGLGGVTLELSGDPLERKELLNLPGVNSVTIG